jgi:hypothetical protein
MEGKGTRVFVRYWDALGPASTFGSGKLKKNISTNDCRALFKSLD